MSSPTAERDLGPRDEGEGQMATELISKFMRLSNDKQKELLQHEASSLVVETFFGMNVGNSASMLTVLGHEKFRKFVYSYCGTNYGKQNFLVGLDI